MIDLEDHLFENIRDDHLSFRFLLFLHQYYTFNQKVIVNMAEFDESFALGTELMQHNIEDIDQQNISDFNDQSLFNSTKKQIEKQTINDGEAVVSAKIESKTTQDNKKGSSKQQPKRSNSSTNIIERSEKWLREKNKKVKEHERQKINKEIRDCSFKPRLTSNPKLRQFNNISNISSFSIIKDTERKQKQNINTRNLQQNAKMEIKPLHKPLIQKWQEEVVQQQQILKEKLDKRISGNAQWKRPNYFLNREHNQSKVAAETIQQYYHLVMKADSLFRELKHLKQQNTAIIKEINITFS